MSRNNVIFGGVDFAENGVWVTGSGTFSAPQRDVTVVSVPGRNGDLVIDNGKWNNIQVTYPCFIRDNFDQNMAAFRSLLCSQLGYQKLEDSYHPDEYRLGAFAEGLFPSMRQRNKGGEFDVIFNCKPQRFLKSGDEPIQIMPVSPSGSYTMRSHYMPVVEDLYFKVHCKSTDSLTVNVLTADANGDQVTSTDYTCADGTENTITFTSSDKFFKIAVSNMTSMDETWLEIQTVTEYNGENIPVNAMMTRHWSIMNPTGFASKPLIEVFADRIPMGEFVNYVNGEQLDFYDFGGNATSVDHLFLDCDMQYCYDDDKNNLTDKFYITSAYSEYGQSLVFPQFGEGLISIDMYFAGSAFDMGIGLVQVYPRWWKL